MTLKTPVIRNELDQPIRVQPVMQIGAGGLAAGAPTTVAVTPAVSATPDYSSGDSIGGVMTVAALVGQAAVPGTLSYLSVTSLVSIGADIDLVFFNANPSGSTFTDNAAAVVAAADLAKIIGKVTLPSANWVLLSGTQYLQALATSVPISGQAAQSIYVAAIARGAINLGSVADLVFRFSAV